MSDEYLPIIDSIDSIIKENYVGEVVYVVGEGDRPDVGVLAYPHLMVCIINDNLRLCHYSNSITGEQSNGINLNDPDFFVKLKQNIAFFNYIKFTSRP